MRISSLMGIGKEPAPAREIEALVGAVARAARESAEALGTCPFSNLIVRRPGAG